MRISEIDKKYKRMEKIRKYCKRCGHSQFVPNFVKKNPCGYCGYPIYRDEKTEFEEKLKKEMMKHD